MLAFSTPNVQRGLRLFLLVGTCVALADLSAEGMQPAPVLPTPVKLKTEAKAPVGLASPANLQAVLGTTHPPVEAAQAAAAGAGGNATVTAGPAEPIGPPPRLAGTLQGSGQRLAILLAGEQTRVATVGETVNGFQVLGVERYSVRLRDPAGAEVRLNIGEEAAAATVAAPPAPVAVQSPQGLPSRRELTDLMNNPGKLTENTRLKPLREGDEVVGMQLSFAGGDHVLGRLGLQTGDVARSLNGHPLKGMQDMGGLISEFRTAQTLHFDLLRGGKPFQLDVTLPE